MPLAQPIYQSMISKYAQDNAGEIMGIQNSARSLGMVIGSLTSGFLYQIGSKLPFLFGSRDGRYCLSHFNFTISS